MKAKHVVLSIRLGLILVLAWAATATTLLADEHFALAFGPHGDLIVSDASGNKVGDFNAPTVGQSVAIAGGPSFQLSFGRDANNMPSAILSPDPIHPADLHFSVLKKTVDADEHASVTLTFSTALNRVSVDPGFSGVVQVNSKVVHAEKATASSTRTPEAAPVDPAAPATSASTASGSAPSAATGEFVPPADTTPGPSVAGGDVGSQLSIVQPVATSSSDQPMSDKLRKRRLFWAEPVTATGRNMPEVASNEMKLVAVHGTVTVTAPDGHTSKGTNGMLVPSGAKVVSATGSSAAVFMGGINSARLVPNSDIVVTQNMEGTVRHTTIDLQSGSVFSRVGKRAGETQSYEVRTPEGVAAARGTEFMDYIINITVDGKVHHVHAVFVNKGTVDLFIGGKLVGTVTGGSNKIGMASMGVPKQAQEDLEKILDRVLAEIQPFNVTTIQALFDYENGVATADELLLIESELYGSIPTDGISLTQEDQQFLAQAAASLQDLVPLTNPRTGGGPPVEEPTSSLERRGR